jgi:hypothetical protein
MAANALRTSCELVARHARSLSRSLREVRLLTGSQVPVTVPQSAKGAPGRIAHRHISHSSLGFFGDTILRMMRTAAIAVYCSTHVFHAHRVEQHSVRFKW